VKKKSSKRKTFVLSFSVKKKVPKKNQLCFSSASEEKEQKKTSFLPGFGQEAGFFLCQ